jgi:hypothetical protein
MAPTCRPPWVPTTLVLLLALSGFASATPIATIGGTGNDLSGPITVVDGDRYLCGVFASPTLTAGSITLTNTGSNTADVFIAKLDSDNAVQWATSFGSTAQVKHLGAAYSHGRDDWVLHTFVGLTGCDTTIETMRIVVFANIFPHPTPHGRRPATVSPILRVTPI